MIKLPPEILHRIFIQLDLEQKLECLTVCRHWWKVLDNYSLFHSVLISSLEQFDRFMDAFERLPHYAAHVEELGVEGPIHINTGKRNFFDIFPNVCLICVDRHSARLNLAHRHSMEHIGNAHSKSKLEYLSDYDECAMTSQMLSLNLGDRLETLVLNFYTFRRPWPTFSQLKDLPVLKTLQFLYPQIKIHEIEDIHNNIPSIQILSLNNVTILAGAMPSNVLPATFIKNLRFAARRYADVDTCVRMYKYMINKYTNVDEIDYYDIGLKGYDADQRRHIYLNGILDFLNLIGPKQSKLFLRHLPDDVDAFQALDAGNSQINDLNLIECATKTMFQYLGQSKQSEYIESIYMLDSIVEVIHPLKSMACLTSLQIEYEDFHDARFNLADCLAACPPTLKHFAIQNGVVFATLFTQQLESIEYLTLSRVIIDMKVAAIISNCFPNLIDLSLRGTLTENVHMVLKSPHFRKAGFLLGNMDDDKDKRYGLSFKCPNMNQSQYHSCSYYNTTQVDCEDIQDLPLLSVESLTEKKLKVGYGVYVH